MAFLTVALSQTRHIDPARVGVYGYSRGGGVALIAGQRDPRFKAVLAFAAPTDFFIAMGRPGVDWVSRLDEALRDAGLQPDTRESQFLDWFVRERAALPLTELRRRIAAASPLYFAERLPPFQIHQGDADQAVPVRNATAVRDRVNPSKAHGVFIYAGAGHMLDDTTAAATARNFLLGTLR
jgi:dipeptidyl aminopeptidase/acylaminoacyl peptidase